MCCTESILAEIHLHCWWPWTVSYWNEWRSQVQLLRGTRISEASEMLSYFKGNRQEHGKKPIGMVLSDREKCSYLPNTWCALGVHVYLVANFKLEQPASSGGPGSDIQYS